MDDVTRKGIEQRLLSSAGHLKGIARMVDEDAYCIDIINQIAAVQAALNKVSTMVLDSHLHTCVTTAVRGNDPDERERVLKEITNVFQTSNKIS